MAPIPAVFKIILQTCPLTHKFFMPRPWLEQLSNLSGTRVREILQRVLMPMLPGMIAAMAISQNVDAWHLYAAALANGVLYIGLGWLACRLITSAKPAKSSIAWN